MIKPAKFQRRTLKEELTILRHKDTHNRILATGLAQSFFKKGICCSFAVIMQDRLFHHRLPERIPQNSLFRFFLNLTVSHMDQHWGHHKFVDPGTPSPPHEPESKSRPPSVVWMRFRLAGVQGACVCICLSTCMFGLQRSVFIGAWTHILCLRPSTLHSASQWSVLSLSGRFCLSASLGSWEALFFVPALANESQATAAVL